jgi:hypothetical protein
MIGISSDIVRRLAPIIPRSKLLRIKNLCERNFSKKRCFITEVITNRTTAFLLTSYLLFLALNLLALSFVIRAPNLRHEAVRND